MQTLKFGFGMVFETYRKFKCCNIVTLENISHSISYVGTPFPCVPAPLHHCLRVQKQEDFGISALKSNGTLFTERKPISEILNTQFKSVFTKKTSSKIPQMSGTSFPSINGLNITEFGVFKLLDKIDVSKASGPDCIPGRILQNLARELAPVLHYIFDQSLNSGDLPADRCMDSRKCCTHF